MTKGGTSQADPRPARGRSLVTVARSLPAVSGTAPPYADFVAQIIACACDVPAFRRARREEPANASLAYSPRRRAAAHELDVSF